MTINKVTAKQEIEEEIEKGTVAAKALMELSKDEASVKLLDELKEKKLLLYDSNTQIIDLKESRKDISAAQASSMTLNSEVLSIIGKIIDVQQQNIQHTRAEIHDFQNRVIIIMVTLTIISIILAICISIVMGRNISKNNLHLYGIIIAHYAALIYQNYCVQVIRNHGKIQQMKNV